VRRVYDPARTPLQRLLLSGVLPDVQQQDLHEVTQALDPLRLLAHLEDLQQALWCGAGKASTSSLLRFSAARCLAGPQPASASEPAEPATEPSTLFPTRRNEVLDGKDFLDGRPTRSKEHGSTSSRSSWPILNGAVASCSRRYSASFLDVIVPLI
jgi:hypothetical protein